MVKRLLRPLILVAVLGFYLPALARSEDPIGQIVQVTGQGRVTNPSLNRDLEARLNLNLYQGDAITTEAESQIKIFLADASLVHVGDESTLTLDEFDYDPGEMVRRAKLDLSRGRIRVLVTNLTPFEDKRFEVQTPTAVAGGQGVMMLVLVKSPGTTIVVGYDKPIYVYNSLMPDVRVIVAAQMMTRITAQQPPTTPAPLPDAARNRFRKIFPASETPGLAPQEATEEGGGGGKGGPTTTTMATTTTTTTTAMTTTTTTMTWIWPPVRFFPRWRW